MSSDPFVHLHVASGYSLRVGASRPVDLVARAAELGQTALALTDRDGTYGAVKFVRACQRVGIRPILGVDLTLAHESAHESVPPRRTPARGGAVVDTRNPRVVVLARGGLGWASLCRLISAAHLGAAGGGRGNPLVTPELVAEHGAGLVVLLGAESLIGRALARRRPDLAAVELRRWTGLLDRAAVRIEVVSHHARDAALAVSDVGGAPQRGLPLSDSAAARLVEFATESGIEAVLANAVRHVDRTGAPVVDALDAIRRLVPLDSRHLDRSNAEGFLKSGPEMARVAERVAGPGARALLAATAELAASCLLDPADLGLDDVHVPELDVLLDPSVANRPPQPNRDRVAEAKCGDVVLRQRCDDGLARRGLSLHAPEVRNRLEAELGVIAELGFAGYFLTVAEVVDLIKSMQVRVAARGSGAGSFVTYLLGISAVDPLRHGLLMERFLSPLRRALPDIDIDVESARRTEVYERILARFGADRCACVSMMDTYRVRHAIRDVGAALGLPPSEVDAFAKAFPHIRAADARSALRDLPELRNSGLGQLAAQGRLDGMLDLVEALDGLPRHVALHPCGVLLSDATLLDRTPVEASWLGFPMSQFDKDDVEELGLLKLDVLGIRMQSAISHALKEIERVDDIVVDIDEVSRDDHATFELIRSTHTLGCFQIESPGQRELIGKFAPETFDDLIVDISLFRPGPVKSDMVHPFLRARQGWSEPQYAHPSLIPAVEETYGVVVFHEQVLRIVSIMTGASLAAADEVRRDLGVLDRLPQVRAWFYESALGLGYDLVTVEKVWEILRAFGSFGFCKAHAAAFAVPTYQSAWLKAHHPAAFLAGVLTHDPGMYPKRLILDDARTMGIAVLGLDVNESDAEYRINRVAPQDEPPPRILDADPRAAPDTPGVPDGRAYGIRLALAEVKGINSAEVERIVAGRPYASLADFWYRAGASRPIVERLILAGAFDSIYGLGSTVPVRRRGRVTRRDLLLQIADLDRWTRSGQRQVPKSSAAEPEGLQLTFDIGPEQTTISGLPELSSADRVRAELEVLGLDVSHHVVDFYAPLLADLGVVRSKHLLRTRSQQEVFVAGVKVATQTPPVRSGRRVVFLTLDDSTGPVDATFFDDVQGPYAATVFHSWLLLVRGLVRRTGPRGVSIRATGAWELGAVHEMWRAGGLAAVRELVSVVDRIPTAPRGRRVLVHPTGFRVSPYSDVKPAGEGNDHVPGRPAPSKLWVSSPGSSGW